MHTFSVTVHYEDDYMLFDFLAEAPGMEQDPETLERFQDGDDMYVYLKFESFDKAKLCHAFFSALPTSTIKDALAGNTDEICALHNLFVSDITTS